MHKLSDLTPLMAVSTAESFCAPEIKNKKQKKKQNGRNENKISHTKKNPDAIRCNTAALEQRGAADKRLTSVG